MPFDIIKIIFLYHNINILKLAIFSLFKTLFYFLHKNFKKKRHGLGFFLRRMFPMEKKNGRVDNLKDLEVRK